MISQSSVLFSLILAVGLLFGCKGERKQDTSEQPFQISEVEAKRGRDACVHYKARVCDCGEKTKDKELLRQCKLATTRIEAFDQVMKAHRTGGHLSREEQGAVAAAVGKVSKGCIEDTAAVDVRCPREP